MAYDQGLITLTIAASTDLSSYQYCAVKIDSNGQVAVAGEGDKAIGVLQNKPAAQGRPASVGILGISRIKAGATVSAGALISTGASGVLIGVGSGDDWSLGVALETTANGKIYSALIQPTGPTV